MFRKWSLLLTILLSSAAVYGQPISLQEKVGQMLMFGFKGMEVDPKHVVIRGLQAGQIGGIVLFDYNFQTKTFDHNIKNPSQLKRLTQQLQDYAKLASRQHMGHLTPLLIGIDYEGGLVNRLKANYGFPDTLSAAAISKKRLAQAYDIATQMAQTLKTAGINLNFAPVVDVNVNPKSPAIGQLKRSFSADARKVTRYATQFAKAYREAGIVCAYKHFPGHGSATGDTHDGFVEVTQTWKPYELDPYRKLLSQPEHCPMVMTAHVVHRGLDKQAYPATLSSVLMNGLLRKKLGFSGIIVTDDLQMQAIRAHYSLRDTVRLSINAGADILVFANQLVPVPQDPAEVVALIVQEVKAGRISEQRIDEAYTRIRQLKSRLAAIT